MKIVSTSVSPQAIAWNTKQLAVSDFAVYPSQGVVQVESIDPRDIAGATEVFYGLRTLINGGRLYVPATRLNRSGLRPLIEPREVPAVLATLRAKPPPKRPPSYKWHQILCEKVNTGNLIAVAEVLRDLIRVSESRPLSATERHILDLVEHHVVSELALVTGRSPESLERDLRRIFKHAA